MTERVEDLEHLIGRLRAGVREAALGGDRERAARLRRELRQAERDWDEALAQAESSVTGASGNVERGGEAGGSLLPLREQVHEALALLSVPTAPRLIVTVHEAFFASTFPSGKLTSLKRDEERSFRSAPYARPYYICAALTADFLSPSRGLLALSTWPMEKRVIGSLSPRVDFLTAAIRVADAIERIPAPVAAARRLLWRFAASIPGAAGSADTMEPRKVIEAAEAERKVHLDADARTREDAAVRARAQLDDAQRLFGVRVRDAGQRASAGNPKGSGAG
ncbi:MAG: hypothetical protein J2P25_05345 [Nocardiopsaceae bacterium]|nr:hypothetical protein [Nocardiopsaceae bacterium]